MNIKTISFCFPYHEVSGVPVLFSNLADYFSKNYTLKVFIVDFADGYMAKRLKRNKRINNFVFETGKSILIDTDVVVMQAILPYAMRPEIKIAKNTRILFWNLHPYNLIPNVYPWATFKNIFPNGYKKLLSIIWRKKYLVIKNFISQAIKLNGLVFMDSANLFLTNDFYKRRENSVEFLPIACSDGVKRDGLVQKNSEINFSWIGRLCDFKIHILNYLIERLSLSARELDQKIILHIIGDGEEKDNLIYKKFQNDLFSVKIVGSLSKADLDNYLIDNIDICASMGTSVLESAKYGIPSIVLDFDYRPIKKNYFFRWLHETEHFDLGHKLTESDYLKKGLSINDIINQLKKNGEIIAEKAFNYYKENHSLEFVSKAILRQAEESQLLISDIPPELLKKSILRRIYEYKKYGKINF